MAAHTGVRARRRRVIAAPMGKNWGWRWRPLGMTGRKVGRTSGFRECPLTLCCEKRNLSSVRRQKPAEPQASTARWERGKPEGKPQGGTKGSRENAARRDRGMGASPARGARPERVGGSVLRWSVVRHGGFPGADVAGSGGGCPTRPRRDASGSSPTVPRGAREASAERLLGVSSRLGSGFPFRSPWTGNARVVATPAPNPAIVHGAGATRGVRRSVVCLIGSGRPRGAGSVIVELDLAQGGPEAGRALARRHLAVQLRLDQGEVTGMRHADAAARGGQHRERAGVERLGHHLGQQDL